MELQVMILDDEPIILDGLCSFPWEDYGFKVAASAKNGIEGMKKLEDTAPDLILSDVKMPGMDGLEFAGKAKEKYPDASIVILTGYDSFAYAQQAIRIGVEEYLLKPVEYEAMKEMVWRLSEEIRAKKARQKQVHDLQKYFQSSLPELRSKFAGNLLHGRLQGREEMEAQEASFHLHIEKYLVCVGRKFKEEERIDKCDKWIEEFACINIFEEIFHEFQIRVLSDYNTAAMEYNFILMFKKEETDSACMERTVGACTKIQQEMEKYLNTSMDFGLSSLSEEGYLANIQYRQAQKACRQCVYLGKNIILKYDELQYENQEEFVITTGEKTHFMILLFQESFLKAEEELRRIYKRAPEDISPVKFSAMELLISCMKFPYTCAVESAMQNKNWNVSVLQDGVRRISECRNTEEVVSCLLLLFETMIKQNTEGTDERNKRLVQSILEYIDKNYGEDLSMEELTEKFHISRTYVSRLLKNYAGQSFLEYLTEVRFRHVEQLIAENKYKQYEIAEMVGYKDFGYYIKVFKKRYGMTPNEYRRHI